MTLLHDHGIVYPRDRGAHIHRNRVRRVRRRGQSGGTRHAELAGPRRGVDVLTIYTANSVRQGTLRVGTSGYQYRHWRGSFYPDDLAARLWLRYYAEHFDTVEINNTFYRLPTAKTFDHWREDTPSGFRFALKYSRYATHMQKLKDPAAALDLFFDRAERLGGKLGPVLVQLPPGWHVDLDRLDAFLRATPRRHRVAIELRDPSWLSPAVFDLLERRKVALVIHDRLENHPIELTAGWTYLRFHGHEYGGSYSHQALSGQALRIRRWLEEGRDVYVYFNNDVSGHAPRNARQLRRYVLGK